MDYWEYRASCKKYDTIRQGIGCGVGIVLGTREAKRVKAETAENRSLLKRLEDELLRSWAILKKSGFYTPADELRMKSIDVSCFNNHMVKKMKRRDIQEVRLALLHYTETLKNSKDSNSQEVSKAKRSFDTSWIVMM